MIMKKQKKVTKENFLKVTKELLQSNIVGFVQKEGKESFDFAFPAGKTFRVYIEEV